MHGDGRGRHIGIPTANIAAWPKQLMPLNGIYASTVDLKDKSYSAVVNIGNRPTFYQPPAERTIEVHLLDFDNEIYGETIRVNFIERLRHEMRFSSAEELMDQIQKDIHETREVLLHATQTTGLSA